MLSGEHSRNNSFSDSVYKNCFVDSTTSIRFVKRCSTVHSFSFRFCLRWHRSAREGPYAPRPVSQQPPQGCPHNSADVCLAEHRSFPTLEGGMSAVSLSPLLFPSGDQCCDTLDCPCSDSSSSLYTPLSCQATDQM